MTYSIHTEVKMTRRKDLVMILDERDVVQWSGQRVGAAIDWLIENGHEAAILTSQDGIFNLHFIKAAV